MIAMYFSLQCECIFVKIKLNNTYKPFYINGGLIITITDFGFVRGEDAGGVLHQLEDVCPLRQ